MATAEEGAAVAAAEGGALPDDVVDGSDYLSSSSFSRARRIVATTSMANTATVAEVTDTRIS